MRRDLVFVLLVSALGACNTATTGTDAPKNGPNCGAGTVEVDGTCQVAPTIAIENGDTRADATTHWTGQIGTYSYNIAFYGDKTGLFWSSASPPPVCPGACKAPTTTSCGDDCVDTTTNAGNCGKCGNACVPLTEHCASSKCVPNPDGGPTSSPGTGFETKGGSGTFHWSTLASGAILNDRTDGHPFKNLTNVTGGVSDANFSAQLDGGGTIKLTLASGPPCQ